VANDVELSRRPRARALRGLDGLNFFLADVQTGVGPFFAIYLAAHAWNEQRVGLALTVGGIAGIVTQTPAGALVDRARSKRTLVAGGVAALAIGALVIAFYPSFWPILCAAVLIGGTASVFIPAVSAISLGIVGREAFDSRQGRNQTFNAAGNVTAAVSMGLIGYLVSNRATFFFIALLTVPTILALLVIPPDEIDYDRARGAKAGAGDGGKPVGLRQLLADRPLAIFLACAVMFHFANAAMLPLLAERLAKGHVRNSMLFMGACVVTTQLVVTLVSSWSGRRAKTWGRKPLLLIAFGVLPIRGVLYTLTDETVPLVAIQILDGVGVGIFNVVSVLVIADLTRGTGRFNVTLGAIATAVGIGASLSQVIAGSIVEHFGFRAGFLFLAAVATAAVAVLSSRMPETRDVNA
jgi:MFS family permease